MFVTYQLEFFEIVARMQRSEIRGAVRHKQNHFFSNQLSIPFPPYSPDFISFHPGYVCFKASLMRSSDKPPTAPVAM